MKPRFITDRKAYAKVFNILGEIREFTARADNCSESYYSFDTPVDDMNWNNLFSILSYIRLDVRSSGAGWCIYFQLYDDDNLNREFFQKEYGVYPFCDCSHVSDLFEFYDIHKSQKEVFGNQWFITGAEDHVVFSKDLSWFLITDCTKSKSTIYFKSTEADIIDIWKQEFSFEMKNSEF